MRRSASAQNETWFVNDVTRGDDDLRIALQQRVQTIGEFCVDYNLVTNVDDAHGFLAQRLWPNFANGTVKSRR